MRYRTLSSGGFYEVKKGDEGYGEPNYYGSVDLTLTSGELKGKTRYFYKHEIEEIKMNCKDKGYEVGQVFKVIEGEREYFNKGDILVLSEDDHTSTPYFIGIDGNCIGEIHLADLKRVKRIWPSEKETVTVTCEGNETEISRESAKALNLI